MKTYLVWRPQCAQTRADAERVDAYTPKQAAEFWAEELDDRQFIDPIIAGGDPMTVTVALDEEGSEAVEYVVSGEIKYEYEAQKVAT